MGLKKSDMLWVLICAALVFLMQAVSPRLNSGLIRGKNALNVAFKNVTAIATAFLLFWAMGFALCFGTTTGGRIGIERFLISLDAERHSIGRVLFQAMFCAASAMIVLGAIAGRMRFSADVMTTVITATKRPRCRRTAFTLADVSITVLIVGVLSAVTVPKFSETLSQTRAESAVARIKADLGLARRRAMSTSSTITVQFFPSTDDYVILGLTDLNHRSQEYSANMSSYPYDASLVSASLGGDSNVQFDLYGRPDSGGTITVESRGYTQTVTVDSDTGRATIP